MNKASFDAAGIANSDQIAMRVMARYIEETPAATRFVLSGQSQPRRVFEFDLSNPGPTANFIPTGPAAQGTGAAVRYGFFGSDRHFIAWAKGDDDSSQCPNDRTIWISYSDDGFQSGVTYQLTHSAFAPKTAYHPGFAFDPNTGRNAILWTHYAPFCTIAHVNTQQTANCETFYDGNGLQFAYDGRIMLGVSDTGQANSWTIVATNRTATTGPTLACQRGGGRAPCAFAYADTSGTQRVVMSAIEFDGSNYSWGPAYATWQGYRTVFGVGLTYHESAGVFLLVANAHFYDDDYYRYPVAVTFRTTDTKEIYLSPGVLPPNPLGFGWSPRQGLDIWFPPWGSEAYLSGTHE